MAGCWYLSHSADGARITYTYAFQAGGAGWIGGVGVSQRKALRRKASKWHAAQTLRASSAS